jgi:signal transduction histidine kinase
MTLSPRYFLASLALLVALVSVHAAWTAHRSQAELRAQMEQKALAVADAVATGSRNAIRSNALLEETIAQRLLDNARLIDALLARPVDPAELARVAGQSGLSRVDLLDRDGQPWTPPAPARGMMRMTMTPPSPMAPDLRGDRPMLRYMWGRRWAAPPEAQPAAPAAITERRFWRGTDFGVAVGARSFPGFIAVHADARSLHDLRREIGVERQLGELAGPAGATAIALLGSDLTVLAHSDAERAGLRPADDTLARALAEGRALSRLVQTGGDAEAFEVARPLTLAGGRPALLTIAFPTAPMRAAWRRDLRSGVTTAASVLLVGALGLAAIFVAQRRHLREVSGLEREVEQRRRLAALGDVAAAFAHEVRNPLNAVSMGLQRLRAEFTAEPADDYTRFVDLVQGEVRRLNAIVEQFLSLARPMPLAPAPIAMADLLREVATLVDGQAHAAGVQVLLALAPGLPEILADRDRLEQVVLNLALNALQAMPAGGTVTLGAEAERDGMVVTVDDTGPGIPEDVRPRIFDPYFTTKPDGLGLGLAIARRIVEAHGGTIDAGVAPGGGARFRVLLPVGSS